jgi:hypothetical protein
LTVGCEETAETGGQFALAETTYFLWMGSTPIKKRMSMRLKFLVCLASIGLSSLPILCSLRLGL